MNFWKVVGNDKQVGETKSILFRGTSDYGGKAGKEFIRVSENWYVWHINDNDFTMVGRLLGENRNSYVGLVINPIGIIEMLKGNKHPVNYPDF